MDEEKATTRPMEAIVDAFEATRPIELLKADTLRDGQPVDFELDDTDVLVINKMLEETSDVTPPYRPAIRDTEIPKAIALGSEIDIPPLGLDSRPARLDTNADWPPAPKQPAHRQHRRAGVYKAISSITKLNALRRLQTSNS